MILRIRRVAITAFLYSAFVASLAAVVAAPDGPIEIDGKLLTRSLAPTPEKLAPYRDALVAYEYQVAKVVAGKYHHPRIRVLHWGIYDTHTTEVVKRAVGSTTRMKLLPFSSQPQLEDVQQANDLDLTSDLEYWYDPSGRPVVELAAGALTPGAKRTKETCEYASTLTDKMADFLRLAPQLKLIGLGDSRALSGIIAQGFYARDNQTYPVAYNLAVESSHLQTNLLLVDTYLTRMPKLEWVVYGTSPRIFKNAVQCPKYEGIVGSGGYRYDLANPLLEPRPGAFVTKISIDHLRGDPIAPLVSNWESLPWGFHVRRKDEPKRPKEAPQRISFEFGPTRFAMLRAIIERLNRRGVKVLAYTPPMHPITANAPAIDLDGTGRADNQALVARLKALDDELPDFHFIDINQGGHSGFLDTDFMDLDHPSTLGAEKLTAILVPACAKIDAAEALKPRPLGIESATCFMQSESVVLTFAPGIDPVEADKAASFAISGGVKVVQAQANADGTRVKLTTSAHAEGTDYTVTVTVAKDRLGRKVLPVTAKYTFVKEFTMKATAPATYAVASLADGVALYVDDAECRYVAVPPALRGLPVLQTAAADRTRVMAAPEPAAAPAEPADPAVPVVKPPVDKPAPAPAPAKPATAVPAPVPAAVDAAPTRKPPLSVRFTVNYPARIYVVITDRASEARTAWLADYTLDPLRLGTAGGGLGERSLFYRDVPAGEVVLAEPAEGAESMYTVIVKPFGRVR